MLKLIHPDDLPGFLKRYHQDLSSGTISNVARIIHPDEAVCYIEAWGILQHDDQGEPMREVGVVMDVTEKKIAERQLREREQQFCQLAELVDDLHWIRSATEPTFSYINSSYERLTGRTAESLYQNPASFLACIHPDDRLLVQAVFTKPNPDEVPYQFRLLGPAGKIYWMEAKAVPVRDDYGQVQYRTGVAKNVTLQREREQFLQDALDQEQALNQRKSSFITTASHEFRTPLTTISSSAELVKYYLHQEADRPSTPLITRHINLILNKIASLDELINDTLTVSKLEEREIKVHLATINLHNFCRGLLETTFSNRSDQRQVVMEMVGSPVEVVTDKKLLSHALTNLLGNAFKFLQTNPRLRIVFDSANVRLLVIDHSTARRWRRGGRLAKTS